MKRSTEWFISGALVFGTAFFLWMEKSSADQRAFWVGTSYMPPIQLAIMNLGVILIPALVIFGIVSLAMGLKSSGVITVEKGNAPTAFSTAPALTQGVPLNTGTPVSNENEIIAKEIVLTPCEFCKALIPKISVFCPTCGVKRN